MKRKIMRFDREMFIALAAFVLLISVDVQGQRTENYDIFSFSPPVGWTRSEAVGSLTFSRSEVNTGQYGIVTVFPSRQSLGNSARDFEREWAERVRSRLEIRDPPQTDRPQAVGRWSVQAGVAPFTFEGRQNVAMLTVFTGEMLTASVLVVINAEAFLDEAKRFVDSITLSGKPQPNGQTTSTEKVRRTEQATSSVAPQPARQNRTGITNARTNFSDGWVATIDSDHVLLTKGELQVLLFYPEPITDAMRPPATEVRDHFWRSFVAPRFSVPSPTSRREMFSQMEYIEGDGSERKTGRKVFVAMNVLVANGIARTVVSVTRERASYTSAFKTLDDLGAMVNANRFAVTLQDLRGEWSGGGAATANLYYVDSGRFAGMTTTAISDKFIFSSNSTYQSMHKGAGGQVGTMQFFSEKYSGRVTVKDWEITLTNRANGKTSVFLAHFEAINGGSVLHLTDKQYSGMQYHLVKVR